MISLSDGSVLSVDLCVDLSGINLEIDWDELHRLMTFTLDTVDLRCELNAPPKEELTSPT